MRTLVHLSDLHFGRVDAATLDPLVGFIGTTGANLVVVSGDLTQRARPAQFAEAKRFLDRIDCPLLVVPGNHDIPLHNVWARFVTPLASYRRQICDDLSPFFADDEMAVGGLNTARSLTTKYGRINAGQLEQLAGRFDAAGTQATRIVVTHHPFDLPPEYREHRQLVGRSQAAMGALARSRVDLLLSGHLHLSHTGLTAARYNIAGHSALVVLAGTATSTRGREEANAFNVLRLEPGRIAVERILWDPAALKFSLATTTTFLRVDGRWGKDGKLAAT